MGVGGVADRLTAVGGLADHTHALGLQQASEPLTEQGMVIDKQHSNHGLSVGLRTQAQGNVSADCTPLWGQGLHEALNRYTGARDDLV
ncbi:hypothetical protein GCM10008955_34000 [Deinococcus malanensis]|uniref:Uncharacterized protein n=1 Tax=Deinococcus malanensis TaxID=1706855 RepID=A0ABQ2F004_9DEIO|nr:hypothetical protein GCM10008955_34000 [Deinococcus malanensis]